MMPPPLPSPSLRRRPHPFRPPLCVGGNKPDQGESTGSGRLLTPHGSAVDPDGLAEAGAGRHLDLVLQHHLVEHRPLLGPDRLAIAPCNAAQRRGLNEAVSGHSV